MPRCAGLCPMPAAYAPWGKGQALRSVGVITTYPSSPFKGVNLTCLTNWLVPESLYNIVPHVCVCTNFLGFSSMAEQQAGFLFDTLASVHLLAMSVDSWSGALWDD